MVLEVIPREISDHVALDADAGAKLMRQNLMIDEKTSLKTAPEGFRMK